MNIKYLPLIAIVIVLFGLAGGMDYEEEKRQAAYNQGQTNVWTED